MKKSEDDRQQSRRKKERRRHSSRSVKTAREKGRGREGAKLDEQPYYHGLATRSEAEALLVHRGDWLTRAVQASRHKKLRLYIVVRGPRHIRHYRIEHRLTQQSWTLDGRQLFDNPVNLIFHYERRGTLPRDGAQLCRMVRRPHFMIDSHRLTRDDDSTGLLGCGRFSRVYSGWLRNDQGARIRVAIKEARGVDMTKPSDARDQMMREAKVMMALGHRNIVRCFGVSADSLPMQIVMEYCAGGTLIKRLQRPSPGNLSMRFKVKLASDAARGLRYLASEGVVHRDVAARNCLLTERDQLKIADFGLSNNNSGLLADRVTGGDFLRQHLPLAWMAPETMVEDGDKVQFTSTSDVYSYGVLLWEMLTDGRRPWQNLPPGRYCRRVKEGKHLELDEGWPAPAIELIRRCFRLNPAERPTFNKIYRILRRLLRRLDTAAVEQQPISGDDLMTDTTDSDEEADIELASRP